MRRFARHSDDFRRAFTLVELLVVVGIIAILIAFLLPALARSREQAVRVQCMSNLRQRGLAVFMYANDNRGHLPHGSWGQGFNESLQLAQRDLLLERYLNGNLRAWSCPSMPLVGFAPGPGGFMPCLPTQFPGGPAGEYVGNLLVADPWQPAGSSPYFKDHLPRINWTYSGWGGVTALVANDRLNSVKGRWVLFTETFAHWEGWPFNIWTNNDLARHFSNKRQSGANSNYPRPDGGSMLMTDGSVVWTSKLYAWTPNHLMATPETFNAGGL